MRLTSALLTLASLGLAAPLSAQDASKPTSTDARVFNFSAMYAGKKLLEGTLSVYTDSMVVTPKSGRCAIAPYGDDLATVARFRCVDARDVEDLVLTFERSAPTNATWKGTVQTTGPQREKTCVEIVGGPRGTVTSPPGCTTKVLAGPASGGTTGTVTGKMKVTAKR